MPAGIVLAGGRSSPAAWLDWHGTTLLRRVCGIVARGAGGPVAVVRAPGQELPPLPDGVRVVDGREGPLPAILAGLEATDADIAFVASVELPFLHPQFVAAVCRGAGDADVAVPDVDGRSRPLAAAYRPALAPLVAELVDAGALAPASLFERCVTRRLDGLPHPESVRAVDAPAEYAAALAEAEPLVRVRSLGPDAPPEAEIHASTLGAAAAAMGVELGVHLLAAINGEHTARDPLEPLAAGDEVTFMAADAAGG